MPEGGGEMLYPLPPGPGDVLDFPVAGGGLNRPTEVLPDWRAGGNRSHLIGGVLPRCDPGSVAAPGGEPVSVWRRVRAAGRGISRNRCRAL